MATGFDVVDLDVVEDPAVLIRDNWCKLESANAPALLAANTPCAPSAPCALAVCPAPNADTDLPIPISCGADIGALLATGGALSGSLGDNLVRMGHRTSTNWLVVAGNLCTVVLNTGFVLSAMAFADGKTLP